MGAPGRDRRAVAGTRGGSIADDQLLRVLVDVRVALTESWDWLLRTDLSDCHDRADHRDCPDSTENIDWKLPNEPIDMADQALPIDANEPTDPIDPNDAVDPIDSTECFEPIESHDPPSAPSERRAESRSACRINGQSGRPVTSRG